MNTQAKTPDDAWEACPPGELQRLVSSTRLHRRARTIRRSVLAGGAATIVALGAWIAVSRLMPTQHCIAGLYCDEVRRGMPDLVAMRVEPKRAAQLQQHIALCVDCRKLMQQMEDKKVMSLNQRHHHIGHCPHCNSSATLVLASIPAPYVPSHIP